ncbi:hypothetical protein DH2020_014552 [Rehmannia glutinosa]|uniref:Uncharacterized protein n=1 Tax=Rehmannia glutinosa TaxID=99300 RepID=A0ABR0WZW8_REHGL
MVLGFLKDDVRGGSLEEGVYHWRVCTSSKTFSKAWLPCMPPSPKMFSSEEYKQWWARVHGNYFEENIENLINSKTKKVLPKGKRHRHGPLGENIRSSPLVHVASSPQRCGALDIEACESNKRKVVIPSFEESSSGDADRHWKRLKKTHKSLEQQEANGVASNQPLTENFVEELEKQLLNNEYVPFCGIFSISSEKFIRNHQQEYLQKLSSDLREKISNIPIDSLSSIQDEVMIVLESMKSFNIIDISFVEGSLKDLFAKAVVYDEARLSSSDIVSKELLA